MTFSIVARVGEAYGIAVASKFLAVGALVPQARLGVGAVASQALTRVAYRDECLRLLAQGHSAAEAVARATAADADRADRQLGVVGPDDAATFTGADCLTWAGGVSGTQADEGYAIQGNILVGPQVVHEMERAWLAHAGEPIERRLLAALIAGDEAGGDRRGRQSAALYAVAEGGGYQGCGVLADLRVDDHQDATGELARIFQIAELVFGQASDVQPLEGDLATEVRHRLDAAGVSGGTVAEDLERWAGEQNLESRLCDQGIDARVLQELRAATGPRP